MTKKQKTVVSTLPVIDQSYEAQHAYLDAMPADPGAAMAGSYQIEPVRQQPPKAWVPGQAAPVRKVKRGVSPTQILQASQAVGMAMRPDDGGALQAMESMSEKSTPVQRGLGFGIVGGVFVAVAGIVSWAMYMAGVDGAAAWTIFGLAVAVTVLLAYVRSEEFSPAGVERFKAKMYAKIRGQEIASDERVSMAKIELLRDLQRELDSDDE